jgi:hypothetical protein
VDESVDGDVQMAMFEEASTTKMFLATARSQSQPFWTFLLTGFRFSPMPFRHMPSPQ